MDPVAGVLLGLLLLGLLVAGWASPWWWRCRERAGGTVPLAVAFVHPDLGIGGAERLVVDAAAGLQRRGHRVTVYTSHHDPAHCFPETVSELRVVVYGDFLPRALFGRAMVLCAVVRHLYLVLRMPRDADVVVVDQISAGVPLLRLLGAPRVVFYCHFPDMLLSARASWLKALYRLPFDRLEEWSTAAADLVLVNSRFTAAVFARTFRSIRAAPRVLYPPINLPVAARDRGPAARGPPVSVLSINRFERKKNISLALRAFAELRARADLPPHLRGEGALRLVVAGGYDPRVAENVEHIAELRALANALHLPDSAVSFRTSISNEEKIALLKECSAVVYTPSNEHFGIVPVEAMYMQRPVVACSSGGPLETVLDGETGFLCSPEPSEFARALFELVSNPDRAAAMGQRASALVEQRFLLPAFAAHLESYLRPESE